MKTFLSQIRLSFVKTILCLTLFLPVVLNAAIVSGTIGNATFYDWDNNISVVYGLDFNNDATNEFAISNLAFDVEFVNTYLRFAYVDNGANIWTNGTLETQGWDQVHSVPYNTLIGAGANWGAQGDAYLIDMGTSSSLLPVNQDCYLGFRFIIGTQIHYGWAQVRVTGNATSGFNAQWIACAYESTPNTAIAAGATSDVGIGEFAHSNVSIYPNPATQYVVLQGEYDQNKENISLFDVNGKELHPSISFPDDQTTYIDLGEFPSGVYFIRYVSHLQPATIKVIKK